MKRERISWWGASYEVEGSKLSLRSKLAKYFFLFLEGQARASPSPSLSLSLSLSRSYKPAELLYLILQYA
jgi:hypothetical protein